MKKHGRWTDDELAFIRANWEQLGAGKSGDVGGGTAGFQLVGRRIGLWPLPRRSCIASHSCAGPVSIIRAAAFAARTA
jgi:hypothetical protein